MRVGRQHHLPPATQRLHECSLAISERGQFVVPEFDIGLGGIGKPSRSHAAFKLVMPARFPSAAPVLFSLVNELRLGCRGQAEGRDQAIIQTVQTDPGRAGAQVGASVHHRADAPFEAAAGDQDSRAVA